MPCPTLQNCGIVAAEPTQNLGGGQFVYLKLSGFAPGDRGVTLYYCSDPGGTGQLPAPGQAPPDCGSSNGLYDEQPQPAQIFPQTSSESGKAAVSMQAAEVSSGGQTIPGAEFFHSGAVVTPGFYCDGTPANPCDIVVTDTSITQAQQDFQTDSSNSVAIPVSFAPSSNGCPNAPIVSANSEFGIELLLPLVARLGCAQNPSTAVVPLDTADNGADALKDLAGGTVNVAFTDDPESPDQQASLKSGSFALIPMALSANVVAFDGQISAVGNVPVFNVGQMDLTPTMVAGLLGSNVNWNGSGLSDDIVPCHGPSSVTGTNQCSGFPCLSTGPGSTCSLFDQLNFTGGFLQFVGHEGFWRADPSGSTDQMFTWLCSAPKLPINLGSAYPPSSYPVESASGARTLEASLGGFGRPLRPCPSGVDQVPTNPHYPPGFLTESDPNQEALKAASFVQSNPVSGGSDAWADMNWAEALFYGMNVAAIQNAADNFVQPNSDTLDAALQDATTNADGTITPSYTNGAGGTNGSGPYPMPDVIYAAVSTAAVNPGQASAEANLLNQILALTGTGGSNVAQLPQGFVPLPANLVTQAQADIKKDIVALPPSPGGGGGGGGGGGSSSGGAPASSASTPSSGSAGSSDVLGPLGLLGGSLSGALPFIAGLSPLSGLLATSVARAANGSGNDSGPSGPLLGPALPGYALAASQSSGLITLALVLGLIALLAGLLLMGSGMLKRRLPHRGASPSGPEPVDGGAEGADLASGAAPA
jgi:hypothetical protein